jgi:hypothetical protein
MTAHLIYLSSSWKNRVRVRSLAEQIRAAGVSVYDFTDPACRSTPMGLMVIVYERTPWRM